MMALQAKRKARWHLVLAIAVLAGGSTAGWIGMRHSSAATTERIVTDYRTGVAIGGYDPVAYFVKSKPMLGRAELEIRYAGVSWRFVNEGNRGAFIANPEVYMPVFGGHDPMGVVRGVAVPGHPEIWLLVAERLYLFRSSQTREIFAADPGDFIAEAHRLWPDVASALAQ
jgi:YHS domain-containing protein